MTLFIILLTVGILAGYQFYYLCTNTTTIESWEKSRVAQMVRRRQIRPVRYNTLLNIFAVRPFIIYRIRFDTRTMWDVWPTYVLSWVTDGTCGSFRNLCKGLVCGTLSPKRTLRKKVALRLSLIWFLRVCVLIRVTAGRAMTKIWKWFNILIDARRHCTYY